jgi:putative DNA primase/helicase
MSNVFLPALTTSAGPAVSSGRSSSASTPDLQYVNLCKADPRTACLHGKLYRWEHDHWHIQTPEQCEQDAFDWLASFDPARATVATARSCADAAKIMSHKLPKSDAELIIIPVLGRWLIVAGDGSINAIEPDLSMGVCHRIQSNKSIPLGEYVPQPLNPDSLFAKFLNRSLPDPQVQALVQEYIGYTLTPTASRQQAQIWIGNTGSNGKSTLLNIVRALHAKAAAMRLDGLKGFELEPLIGASLAFCDEAPQGHINQQILKTLIAGGELPIRGLYERAGSYAPQAKWILCTNHLPKFRDTSTAWWRRFHVIEWNQRVTGKDIIHDLDRRIVKSELDLVLDWALEGLQRLIRQKGFAVPQQVDGAKRKAMQEADSVLEWVEHCGVVRVASGKVLEKSFIYKQYQDYCHRNGLFINGNAEFFKRLLVVFPDMESSRISKREGNRVERPRCYPIGIGVFADDLPTADPHATLNAMLVANTPAADEDFDPFKNR